MKSASRVWSLLLLAALCPSPCRAEGAPAVDTSAEAVNRCMTEHEQARLLRLKKHWLAARTAMAACAAESCPLALRTDCRTWADELARSLPSLLLVIERDDDGVAPATLHIDGQRLELVNPSRPIEVLPGTHRLSVTLEGYPALEQEVVLAEGEKNHLLRFRFVRERTSGGAEPTPLPPAAQPMRVPARPVPNHTYWLSGAALASVGVSGALLASALSSLHSARETCAPRCASSERRSIDRRLLAADLFGAGGVALGALAVYTYLSRPTLKVPVASGGLGLDVAWSTAGTRVELRGNF